MINVEYSCRFQLTWGCALLNHFIQHNTRKTPILSSADRACLDISGSYQASSLRGMLNPDNTIYRKTDVFSRHIEPHQVGQWLAGNITNTPQAVELFNKLAHFYTTGAQNSTYRYVAESILHGTVWHLVITLVQRGISSVWGLAKSLCEPFRVESNKCPGDACVYLQCLHGIGHGALYNSLFEGGIMRMESYGPCSALPTDALPMHQMIVAANSACDEAPSTELQKACFHGAYHAASLLGFWGVAELMSKHLYDDDLSSFEDDLNQLMMKIKWPLCAEYALLPNICFIETSCYQC